jgi:hypothetical protein
LFGNSQILSVFRVGFFKFISDPELSGSGMIFPDPDPFSDPASDQIKIHNTATVVILITCFCDNAYSANCYANLNFSCVRTRSLLSLLGRPRHGKPTTGMNY